MTTYMHPGNKDFYESMKNACKDEMFRMKTNMLLQCSSLVEAYSGDKILDECQLKDLEDAFNDCLKELNNYKIIKQNYLESDLLIEG